jgi:hypothetical protein
MRRRSDNIRLQMDHRGQQLRNGWSIFIEFVDDRWPSSWTRNALSIEFTNSDLLRGILRRGHENQRMNSSSMALFDQTNKSPTDSDVESNKP